MVCLFKFGNLININVKFIDVKEQKHVYIMYNLTS